MKFFLIIGMDRLHSVACGSGKAGFEDAVLIFKFLANTITSNDND